MDYLSIEDINKLKPRLSEEEYLELLYYNYPSTWIEEYLPNPQDLDLSLELRFYQKKIVNCHNKKRILRLGRQMGKSAVIQFLILFYGFKVPNSKILVIGPQKTHVEEIFNEVENLISRKPYLKSLVSSKRQPLQMIFQCGSKKNRALFLTTGEDSGGKGLGIRGKTGSVLIVDEADYINDEVMEQVIIPTTNSYSDPTIILSSTPSGRKGFYRKMWDSGFYSTFHFKSCEAPSWNKDKEAQIRAGSTKRTYQREYEAEWGDSETGLFSKDDMNIITKMSEIPFNISSDSEGIIRQYTTNDDYTYLNNIIKPRVRILGVDWNKAKNGVRLIWCDFDENHNMWFRKKWKIDQADFTQNAAISKIIELHRELKFNYIMVDVGFGCVHKDTIVYTLSGSKAISNLNIGDSILSHDGTYNKVTNLWKVEPKNSYKLSINKCPNIIISHCHPIFSFQTNKKFKFIKNINEDDIVWNKAEDLSVGDFVAIAKEKHININPNIDLMEYLKEYIDLEYDENYIWSKYSNSPNEKLTIAKIAKILNVSKAEVNRTKYKLKNSIELNKFQTNINDKCKVLFGSDWFHSMKLKFSRFINILDYRLQMILGWYISEGNVNRGNVEIWQKKSKYMDQFLIAYEYAKQLFPNTTLTLKRNGTQRIIIGGNIVSALFTKLCGKLSQNKIMNDLLYSNITPYFMQGLFMGDGHLSYNKELQISLTSQHLIYQLRQLFINVGILPSLYYRKARKQNHQDQYALYISGNNQTKRKIMELTGINLNITPFQVQRREFIETENYILVPIIKKQHVGINSDLIDITVENTNSFIGNGICLHNSMQIEDLHLYGLQHPETKLDKIVKGVSTDSQIEITDVASGNKRKTYIKNFIVESMVRFVEQHRLRVPEEENLFDKKSSTDQSSIFDEMNEYIIARYTSNGRPVYEGKAGDHDLDALMFTLYGYLTEVIKTQELWQALPKPKTKIISFDQIMKHRVGLKSDDMKKSRDEREIEEPISSFKPRPIYTNLDSYTHRSLNRLSTGRTNSPFKRTLGRSSIPRRSFR